jgi:NADPH-dependent 2,4-dienoyl-CoA reductase/sulfur reductase-like enzyme
MPNRSSENRALNATLRREKPMTDDRMVVVGASLAGLLAVEAARKTGFEGWAPTDRIKHHREQRVELR